MDVLMVATELGPPHARVTAAADTVSALSKTLTQMGHEVTVALPRYPALEAGGLLVARRLTPLTLPSGDQVTVLDGQLATGVKIVLFDSGELYDRPGIYGDADGPYPDNAKRFGTLCQAACALCQQRRSQGSPFDVVHLMDWPAAPTALALERAGVSEVARVLTVHDIGQQGSFPGRDAPGLGFPPRTQGLKHGGRVSFLRLGLIHADAVTTVSPSYAADLASAEHSGALADVVAERADAITGVLGGLDYAVYNPATDPKLKHRYDAEDAANKGSSRTELVRGLGLELEVSRPLVGAVVESAEGAELLVESLAGILRGDLTLVICARAGQLPDAVSAEREHYPERLGILQADGEATLRRLCAAADLLLLPQPYDPGALVARCAQRYGALPVACAQGGIRDAVVDCDASLQTGTGFLFGEPSPRALVGAVQRGLAACASEQWLELRRRVMRLDLSWDRPARRYLQVYRQALAARRG